MQRSKHLPSLKVPSRPLFRQFLSRPPTKEEQATLMGYYQQQLGRLHAGELQASDLTASQEGPCRKGRKGFACPIDHEPRRSHHQTMNASFLIERTPALLS